MIKKFLSALATGALALGMSATPAQSVIVGEYGYGDSYFDICNFTDESYVTFYTDVTNFEHSLSIGECITIWSDYSYIIIDYDESWAQGNQFDTVYLYGNSYLEFQNWGYDYYGELIGHSIW